MKRILGVFFMLALATIAPLTVAAQEQQRTWGTKGQGGKTDANVAKNQPAPTVAAPKRVWGSRSTTVATTQPAVHHPDWRPIRHDNDRDEDRPPGWSHGRKVGWHGNDMPPGQMKKDPYEHHYRHYGRHHHRREWERDHERWRRHREHDRQ